MSTPSFPLSLPTLAGTRSHHRARVAVKHPELLLLLLLAGVLDLWGLSTNGLANDYYAAAVQSMTKSWSAFIYGSFDTSNVMTVDKPPLALWVQALSARAFGFSSWSILVPQALMGVATVGLAYDLVRRVFGRPAAFAAGLALALTPVTVALSRHNNPDALLTLCSVGAVWALLRALTDGRTRWLVVSGVGVGLGFEAKMAAALLVVPSIVAAYLWIAPRGRLVALRQLAAGGAAMTVVGLAWPVLMWAVPAGSRPWISGTSDNSIWSLITGYNGLGRLFGQDGGPGAAAAGGVGGGAAAGPGGGGGGGVFGGSTGPFRLLNDALGGQAGWLLGFAAVAGLAVLVLTRLRRADPRTGWLILVGGASLTIAVAFSRAQGIFHPYYVSLLAPFTAALVGAGVGEALKGGRVLRVLGPAMVAAGVACELVVLHDNPGELGWLVPLLVAGGAAACVLLAGGVRARLRAGVVAAVLALLLIAPGAWAFTTLGHATSSTFPAGGPQSAGGTGGMGGPGGTGMRGRPGAAGFGAPPAGAQRGAAGGTAPTAAGGGMPGGEADLAPALAYAKAHGGGTVAVSSQNGAASTLVASGADVAAIGGFSGQESQVSAAWLADAVAAGKIRWVLTTSSAGTGQLGNRVGSKQIMATAAEVGTPVTSVTGLYDLQGKAAALRAAA